MTENGSNLKEILVYPAVNIVLVFYSALTYFLFEWLFIVTKPSFMSGRGLLTNLQLFFTVLAPVLSCFVILAAAPWILLIFAPDRVKVLASVCRVFPALIVASWFFVWLSNFTHTVFSIGVDQITDSWRLLYGFIFIVFALFSFKAISELEKQRSFRDNFALLVLGAFFVYLVSVSSLLLSIAGQSSVAPFVSDFSDKPRSRPNILIISSDALDAASLSAYGYSRETTPFLNDFSKQMLFCENAFTNVTGSPGSLSSMLLGRPPIETGVFSMPEILRGSHSYDHLPGILRGLGYVSMEFASPDSFELNMRNAYDQVNLSRKDTALHRFLGRYEGLYNSFELYFILYVKKRLVDLLVFSFSFTKANASFLQLTAGSNDLAAEQTVIEDAIRFMTTQSSPFFVHMHMLGTHGPLFDTKHKKFSLGKEALGRKDPDFYDDAILDFDSYFADIVSALAQAGRLENTLIVLHSDHSNDYRSSTRIPLLFYFPEGEHRGRIETNVQLLDVLPTILGYMGFEPPPWCLGSNLLDRNRDPYRPIFSIADWRPQPPSLLEVPDYRNFRTVTVIVCDAAFSFDLRKQELSFSPVVGHTKPCPPGKMPREDEIKEMIDRYLSAAGGKR